MDFEKYIGQQANGSGVIFNIVNARPVTRMQFGKPDQFWVELTLEKVSGGAQSVLEFDLFALEDFAKKYIKPSWEVA